jgi:uncharacterized integral membrane protein (TIGR00698 family)
VARRFRRDFARRDPEHRNRARGPMTAAPDPSAPRPRSGLARLLPGVALSGALALTAMFLARAEWLQRHGVSALTAAIAVGLLVGNTLYPRLGAAPVAGIHFSKQTLLRAGVVLYGLRLTLQDVAHVGVAGVAIDAAVVTSTFLLACLLGRWLGLDRKTSMLIGAGSSICGAAAVFAAEPVVDGRPDQVTVAVATVVLFGTAGIFLYPEIYRLNHVLPLIPADPSRFGIYIGSTVHEVAQVIAAARSVAAESADMAVITKMVRVMMLAPFLLGLSAWLGRHAEADEGGAAASPLAATPVVPWFALGFIAVVLFNSLELLPAGLVDFAIEVDTALLAMAMAALGLTTQVEAFRRAGLKPLFLAFLLFLWLVAGGAVINRALPPLLGAGL